MAEHTLKRFDEELERLNATINEMGGLTESQFAKALVAVREMDTSIAEEVIVHLSGLLGARVTVTLEIAAEIPAGAPENVVRTVTENSRTLKFTSQGFETE